MWCPPASAAAGIQVTVDFRVYAAPEVLVSLLAMLTAKDLTL